MRRVLEFWSAGGIHPGNPFLHTNLREKESKRLAEEEYAPTGTVDIDLEGYSPTEEGDKILEDINELET